MLLVIAAIARSAPAGQVGTDGSLGTAGPIAPVNGTFTIPASLGNGDQTIMATYGGVSTQSSILITIRN